MVSIVKNQLLKHLSRYCKNLSSDKINISTFRGEGELHNLQLDEDVLNDLLELPGWLRLTSAWCNHVAFRIHWTKLKSVPITMVLDEVNVTLETCELDANGRRPGGSAAQPGTSSSAPPPLGKYSFVHKIIDGITITVNTVNVKFRSPAFAASVQMSRIRVESKTPRWLAGDLRVTRLKDAAHEQLLIFKELSWQTVRIEASSTQDDSLTPLRLLTNQARCRITIKKRMQDCSIVSSRLVLILDDLLWVLTDSQLKAALHFVDSLAELIKRSTQLTQRIKAQKKLAAATSKAAPVHNASGSAGVSRPTADVSATQKTFNMFDVHETSYHFFSQRIDLHLCDDPGEGRSGYPDLRDGGALQISVQGFQVDYYPFHQAASGRTHWPKYKEATLAPALWLEQSLAAFRESLLNHSQPNRAASALHAPLERSSAQLPTTNPFASASGTSTPMAVPDSLGSPQRRRLAESFQRLMTACVVLRIEDFTLYQVTTSGKKQMPKQFVACDKDRYSFPADMSTIHAEFTYFYYPGDSNFPLPPNKMFVHVNPVQIHFHLDSCLWFNAFALNLHESLRKNAATDATPTAPTPLAPNAVAETPPGLMYMDVKFEAIMPRIIIEAATSTDAPAAAATQRDRPKAMQVQISRLLCTNIRELGATRADLAQALHSLQEGSLVFASSFPTLPDDLCVVTDRILSHVTAADVAAGAATTPLEPAALPSPPLQPAADASSPPPGRYAFCAEPRDIWCMKLDPLWIDFVGARSVGSGKSVPFVDAVPITLWLHGNALSGLADDLNANPAAQSADSSPATTATSTATAAAAVAAATRTPADLHAIAHIANMVSVQIDHFQYLFLLRLAEELTELSTFAALDAERIERSAAVKLGAGDGAAMKAATSIVFGCVVPQLELTLVMPSQTPGKENSAGDAESMVPDSASLCPAPGAGQPAMTTSISQQQPIEGASNGLDLLSRSQTETVTAPRPPSAESRLTDATMSPPRAVAAVPPAQPNTPTPPAGNNAMSTSQTQPPSRSTPRTQSRVGSVSDFGSSLLTMKKGFSNFMTSIDTALKSGPGSVMGDDASDSFSIQSDISSDSDTFQMVLGSGDERTTDCMEVMFSLNPFANEPNAMAASAIEVASEACDEEDEHQRHMQTSNASSPSEPSDANSWRRRDLVSMVTFRLTTVEVIHQNVGNASSLRLQLSALSCDECGAIPWDELQTKFGARCRAWNIAPYNPEAPPCVRLRLDDRRETPAVVGPIVDRKSVLDWFKSNVEVRVSDLSLDLNMSTVLGLVDLAEDEIIGKPLPAEIELENVRLHLVEDRPPVNVTSPGPVPIDLAIGRMRIRRDADGIIQLQPVASDANAAAEPETAANGAERVGGQRDREVLALQLVMQQLKLDNEHLKWQLRMSEKSAEHSIGSANQETQVLKNCLNKAQSDVDALLGEKRMLLDTVRSLQQQLQVKAGVAFTSLSGDVSPNDR